MVRYVSLLLSLTSVGMVADSAHAQIHINGSVSQSSSNAGYVNYSSNSGSAGIDVSLGSHVRIGLAHSQQFSVAEGWAIKEEADETSNDPADFNDYSSRTHVMGNSIDFTFVLYNGEVVTPFLKAGLIWKTYIMEENEAGVVSKVGYRNLGPLDNLGAGIAFALNRQFSLNLSYNSSPGQQAVPGEKMVNARDNKTALGLSYKL